MIVRFCYAVYLQPLNQHNQEFRPYIPDPLSRGAREGLGTRLRSDYSIANHCHVHPVFLTCVLGSMMAELVKIPLLNVTKLVLDCFFIAASTAGGLPFVSILAKSRHALLTTVCALPSHSQPRFTSSSVGRHCRHRYSSLASKTS